MFTKHISHELFLQNFRLHVYRQDHPEFGWFLQIDYWPKIYKYLRIKKECEIDIIKEYNKYIFLIDQEIMTELKTYI